MRWVKKLKINKMQPKPTVKYPIIRLPSQYAELIGKTAQLYETEVNEHLSFLIVVSEDRDKVSITPVESDMEKRFKNLENQIRELRELFLEIEGIYRVNPQIENGAAEI